VGDFAVEVGGDLGDQGGGDPDAIELLDDVLDVAGGQPLGVQGEDLVVEALEAALILGDQLRLEGTVPVDTPDSSPPLRQSSRDVS
jgi:hypothetical protein